MPSKNFASKLKKLIEVEEKSKLMAEKVRIFYPDAKKVVYDIDIDSSNERIYYDFACIVDKNDNIIMDERNDEEYKDEVYELMDDLNSFIWQVASFDDTLFEQQFSFDFDTFEVTIHKFLRGKQIKPVIDFQGFWEPESIPSPWWFHHLPQGFYEIEGKVFGIENLEYPKQNIILPRNEDSFLKQVLIENGIMK
jgi:hypothetical protein